MSHKMLRQFIVKVSVLCVYFPLYIYIYIYIYLLFILYINDLPNISDNFKSSLFADDTNLIC